MDTKVSATDAKLNTAIQKWSNSSYTGDTTFQKELESLYKSFVDATQDGPGQINVPRRQKQIENFLSSDNEVVDRCVRWHLLKLAIDNARSEKTRSVHLRLAKMIMAFEKVQGWKLLFLSPTGNTMNELCKREQNSGRPGQPQQKQTKGKALEGPAVVEETTRSPHFSVRSKSNKEKSLFATALYNGHPFIRALLVEVKDLYRREHPEQVDKDELLRRTNEEFANLVRSSHSALPNNIVKNHKTAHSAFGPVLQEIPGVLQDPDKMPDKKDKFQQKERAMLDQIIEKAHLQLADAILTSELHYKLLTSRERVVKALKSWMACRQPSGNHHDQDDNTNNNKNKDDDGDGDGDDGDGDDGDDEHGEDGSGEENKRRDLAVSVLSHAPDDVLKSPEVLNEVMKHSLFENTDILRTYAKDAELHVNHDGSTTAIPFESFKPVASFLKDVPGILHMAVFYQQRPLVEMLLRHTPLLAVTRAYVHITSNETVPKRKESESSAETSVTVDGANAANGIPREQQVQKEDSGYYPLWYSNEPYSKEKNTMTWKYIRSALIYCTMKRAENVQTLLTILRDSKEHEINFDMSRLLIEGTSVADFVRSMPRQGRSYSLIHYEETIRYAEFPVLDLSTQPQTPATQSLQREHLERTHTEILDMLDWLEDHGVHRIITLRVPDRMAHPHDELEIANVVKRFHVEELDWRILDLSLSIFQPHSGPEDIPLVCSVDNDKNDRTSKVAKAKDEKNKIHQDDKNSKGPKEKGVQKTYLTRLHLYTGGRRSALDHWFSTEGLASMNLEHVYIHVIKELTTKKQSDETLKYIYTKIEDLRKRKTSMQIGVQSQFWTPFTETPRLQDIIHRLSPRLAQFVAYYRQLASGCHDKHKNFRPAKVAIIDNGILSIDPSNAPRGPDHDHAEDMPNVRGGSGNNTNTNTSIEQHLKSQDFVRADSLWARVCDGKSFVHEPDRVSPWYFASNPHGTQMANLVCAIDPLCQLFVAKIADGHYGYSAVRAAAAVNWAIEKGVDIISMSFTTTEDNEDFKNAVGEAKKRGILIVCSHHDEGARISTKVYPAYFGDDMLRMASCNMYGKLQHDWDDNTVDEASKKNNQYEFCINSQDVAVGAIPFLAPSNEHISGSSVATAIAAGICSLLIACLRTLDVMPIPGTDKIDAQSRLVFQQMHDNVKEALFPKTPAGVSKNDRPSYASIRAYLETMAPSNTNRKFISLDRFAHLDELRDVNTHSVSKAFFDLGAKFPLSK